MSVLSGALSLWVRFPSGRSWRSNADCWLGQKKAGCRYDTTALCCNTARIDKGLRRARLYPCLGNCPWGSVAMEVCAARYASIADEAFFIVSFHRRSRTDCVRTPPRGRVPTENDDTTLSAPRLGAIPAAHASPPEPHRLLGHAPRRPMAAGSIQAIYGDS